MSPTSLVHTQNHPRVELKQTQSLQRHQRSLANQPKTLKTPRVSGLAALLSDEPLEGVGGTGRRGTDSEQVANALTYVLVGMTSTCPQRGADAQRHMAGTAGGFDFFFSFLPSSILINEI